jgi:hypothetical protein
LLGLRRLLRLLDLLWRLLRLALAHLLQLCCAARRVDWLGAHDCSFRKRCHCSIDLSPTHHKNLSLAAFKRRAW